MFFNKRREEREYREWQYEQSRREEERKRREEEAEAERKRQERERISTLSERELLVELLYEIKDLRGDVARFNDVEFQKMQKAIDDIQSNVDYIWMNTMD